MRKLFSAIAVTLCAVLSVSACTSKEAGSNSSDNNGQPAPGAPNPDATPGIQTIDGYKTDARLGDGLAHIDLELPWSDGGPELMTKGRFQVLSLDRKGDNVRMVAAWLEPESGPFMGSRALASGMDALNYSPTTKLWDPQTNEIISPLQLNDESNRDKSTVQAFTLVPVMFPPRRNASNSSGSTSQHRQTKKSGLSPVSGVAPSTNPSPSPTTNRLPTRRQTLPHLLTMRTRPTNTVHQRPSDTSTNSRTKQSPYWVLQQLQSTQLPH